MGMNAIGCEWHDVKKCLPKLDKVVIVATKDNVFPAVRIRKNGQQFWTNAVWGFKPMESHTGKVLYWCHLPVHPMAIRALAPDIASETE